MEGKQMRNGSLEKQQREDIMFAAKAWQVCIFHAHSCSRLHACPRATGLGKQKSGKGILGHRKMAGVKALPIQTQPQQRLAQIHPTLRLASRRADLQDLSREQKKTTIRAAGE